MIRRQAKAEVKIIHLSVAIGHILASKAMERSGVTGRAVSARRLGMTVNLKGSRAIALAGLGLALSAGTWAQSTPSSTAPASAPAAQPAPGTTPIGSDAPSSTTAKQQPDTTKQPDPGTTPVGSDTPPTVPDKKPAPGTTPVGGDTPATAVNPDKVVEPGSQKVNVKSGSIDDVSAVGNRDIGGRGLGNWYSVDTEIKMGKMYASEIEKSTKFINDPVVLEYVNRVGQNIVKNSDCKVPFTIKIIDSDEINAFALHRGPRIVG